MKLYEINEAILDVIERGFCFDEETGEILFDESNLNELEAMFTDKMEACALYTKDVEAMAAAIKAEEQALAKRRKSLERKAEHMRRYMLAHLKQVGGKMETARCKLCSRKSESVVIENAELIPRELGEEVTTFKPDKRAIKAALKGGEFIPGVELVKNESLQLK